MAHYGPKIKKLLDELQEDTEIPVMTIMGTYCPVTKGHLGCLVEGRHMLMDQPSECPKESNKATRPTNLPVYNLALGLIGCNDDRSTQSKMFQKGCPEAFIDKVERLKLIDYAADDDQLEWLKASEDYHATLKALKHDYPQHKFIRYSLNGADDVLKYKKWRKASSTELLLCAGRPSEVGKQNGTADLINEMTLDDKGPDSEWYNHGYFTILPELEDISSSKVRKYLQAYPQDFAALKSLLHPMVLRWSLKMGPYAPNDPALDDILPPLPNAGVQPLPNAWNRAESKYSNVSADYYSIPGSSCIVRRQCKPYYTVLRENPKLNDPQAAHGDKIEIVDGEEVYLTKIDPTRLFGFISAEIGSGWIRLEYVFPSEGQTIAFIDRKDGTNGTCLRLKPSEERKWVNGGDGKAVKIGNGEKVILLYPNTTHDGRRCWDFVNVRVPSKHIYGWIKPENLRFN